MFQASLPLPHLSTLKKPYQNRYCSLVGHDYKNCLSCWPHKWGGPEVFLQAFGLVRTSSSSKEQYNYALDTNKRLKTCLQASCKILWSNCGILVSHMSWSRVHGTRVCPCVLPQRRGPNLSNPKGSAVSQYEQEAGFHHLIKTLDGSLLHTMSQRHCGFIHSTSSEFKPQKC